MWHLAMLSNVFIVSIFYFFIIIPRTQNICQLAKWTGSISGDIILLCWKALFRYQGLLVMAWGDGKCFRSRALSEEIGYCTGNNINMYSYLFFFLLWRQELTKVPRSGLNLQSFCFSLPSNWGYWYATPCLAEWHLMQPCFSWPLGPISQSFSLALSPNNFRAHIFHQ